MVVEVEVPGIGIVELPDGTTREQAVRAIKKNMPKLRQERFKALQAKTTRERIEPLSAPGEALVGLGSGLKQFSRGVSQTVGEIVPGLRTEEEQRAARERGLQEKAEFAATPAGRSFTGQAGQFAGQVLPTIPIPIASGAGLLARLGGSAVAGGIIGGTQPLAPDQSRAAQAVIGTGIGLLAPPVLGFAGRTAGKTLGKIGEGFTRATGLPKGAVSREALAGVIQPEVALARKKAAQEIGVQITPAESGQTLAAQFQGRLGRTQEGAAKLQRFGLNRQETERKVIADFLTDISPTTSKAAEQTRRAASKVLKGKRKALSNAAKPLYEKALKQEISQEAAEKLAQDPVISDAFDRLSRDTLLQAEIKGLPLTSVKVGDQVKRFLDDDIAKFIRSGERNRVRILKEAKDKLVNTIDESVPDYKAARSIFSDTAKPVQRLESSDLGKISTLKDDQLQKVAGTIFDAGETDSRVLRTLRDEIWKQDQNAWRKITRLAMERKLDQVAGDRTGSRFFRQILSKENEFNQFAVAVEKIPGARRKLNNMRKVFKDLIDVRTVKGAAGLAQTSLSKPRSLGEVAVNLFEDLTAGSFDDAAINVITSPAWDKALKKAIATSGRFEKYKAIADVLRKASVKAGIVATPQLQQ